MKQATRLIKFLDYTIKEVRDMLFFQSPKGWYPQLIEGIQTVVPQLWFCDCISKCSIWSKPGTQSLFTFILKRISVSHNLLFLFKKQQRAKWDNLKKLNSVFIIHWIMSQVSHTSSTKLHQTEFSWRGLPLSHIYLRMARLNIDAI